MEQPRLTNYTNFGFIIENYWLTTILIVEQQLPLLLGGFCLEWTVLNWTGVFFLATLVGIFPFDLWGFVAYHFQSGLVSFRFSDFGFLLGKLRRMIHGICF